MEIVKYKGTKFDYYQVTINDNLNTISKKFNVTPNKVVRNNTNVDFYEGEVVKIIYDDSNIYIVKPLETLSTIAEKYNTSVEELVKLNNLKSTRLFIGQHLTIKQ